MAIIAELAGNDAAIRKSLGTFVDLNQSWKPYRPSSQTAPALSAGAAAFWATAMEEQISMLDAVEAGNGVLATDAALEAATERALAKRATGADVGPNNIGTAPNVIAPSVGDGLFEIFTTAAQEPCNTWLNLTPVTLAKSYTATASSSVPTYQDNNVERMVDDDASTLWCSSDSPVVGSTFIIDLGEVKEVGKVLIQQDDSDTNTGDMFYNARVEYSTDNATWTPAGTFERKPRIELSFHTPVNTRYTRMVAAAPNPGDQWVKVREFQAFDASKKLSTDLAGANGTGPVRAFDVSIDTAFESAVAAVEGSHLTHMLDAPEAMKSAAIVGHITRDLQVKVDGEWVTLGALDPELSFQEVVLTQTAISGVRILFTPGAKANPAAKPVVYELGLRATGPVAEGPCVGEEVERTATAIESAASSPTATQGSNTDDDLANTGSNLGAAAGIALLFMLGGLIIARRRKPARP